MLIVQSIREIHYKVNSFVVYLQILMPVVWDEEVHHRMDTCSVIHQGRGSY